eukprot:symbB.v1.2.020053.t1/scaffold1665.1/size106850/14
MEIRQGPERRSHDIEAGSMVLAAIVIGEGQTTLLSWRVGEGAVPGFMDVAVASMRFCESAAFEASEVVQTCPTYEGQTPLRSLELNELKPWLIDSLKEEEVSPGASPPVLLRRYCRFPWTGQSLVTSKAGMTFNCRKMAVSSLPPTEAVDLCLLEEDGQLHFLELERAHGNAWVLPKALAKVGRFEEAAEAYRRALDAVRRSSFYKALFPTERGHIQGAYSREAIEGENPLEKLSPEEVSMRRGQLVALHLNLSLCATKAGLFALARRHAETALGAEPENAKALFRRGQAAAGQGDYEDALKDLQKAAELMPQDRGIRSEIQAVQRDLRVHREAQKNMFVNVFQPPNRAQGEKQTRAFAMKKGHEACQCVDGKHVSKIAYSDRCFFAQAYDSGRKAKKSLESQSSVELGLDDFETQVLRSNEVWFVQAYDPNDGGCKSFATGWEDVAHTYGEHARFGRLDVSKAELKSLLPFKPVLLPVVFRYARGMSVEHWMFSERMARQEDNAGGGKALMNFMEGNFPEFHRHNDASELKRWWSVEEPRILMVGPSSSSLAAKAKDFMPVFRMAHVWEEFFNVASADAQAMVEVLGSDYAFDRGQTWALILRGSDGAVSKEHVRNVRDMAPLIQDFISEEITRQAPVATLRNYQQLCGDSALTQGTSKTYCLILVDASVDETAKALRELESSRKAYYQEVQELRNAGEDSEEPFRIQPVRVASSSSRLPWKPAAPGSSFAAVWAEASKARAFILEMESRKYAAVKTPSLNEIFQSIAYEDLKLEELHEDGPPLSRLFSDPETTLRREVSAFLSTTICAYVLVALVVSVAPELELLQLAVPLVVLVVVLMLASPTLNRKVISIFWCTLRSSSMECQRNF